MRCSAGSTGCSPARRRRSAPPMTEVDRLKPRYQDKAVLVGNPVRDEVARLGEMPFPPFDEFAPLQDPGHRRKPGRERARQGRPRRPRRCSSRRSATGCRSSSNAAPTTSSGCGRAMPSSASRPSSSTYIEDMPDQARRRASGDRPRRRLDHRRADRRRPARDPHPLRRRRPTTTRPPMRAKWPRPAARGRSRRTGFTPDVSRARSRRWPPTRRRSPMPPRARCRSAGPHAARDLADLVERIGGGASPIDGRPG